MQFAMLACLVTATAAAAPDTVVVCPAAFRAELEPWLTYRREQGHTIAVVPSGAPQAVRAEIRREAGRGKLKAVLLIGDAWTDARVLDDKHPIVPVLYTKAHVNVRFGSTPEIATDNPYADLDDDHVPDIAIGRLPCDTPEELAGLIRRIIRYERCADFGVWRRQVHFVAGLGGFGAVTDAVIEAAAKSLIGDGIPAQYATTMTYGSWQSPYCPNPRRFSQATIERLNEGGLFWVYMGHGSLRTVDDVFVPGANYSILTSRDAGQLACGHGAPIACLLSCYSGAFDQPRDCLAEDLLKAAGGPVAVLCGSRVTLPYGMSVLGVELLDSCFVARTQTLGEALLLAKRRLAQPSTGGKRAMLDAMAKAISPTGAELDEERREHLDLFNLLGDPLLRIGYPGELAVRVEARAQAGQSLSIAFASPIEGDAVVELAVKRDRLTFRPALRAQFVRAEMNDYDATYLRANDPRVASCKVGVNRGQATAQLRVPDDARGLYHVRVFVQGADGCTSGAAEVRVEEVSKRD
jgi:hypothetical protein